MVWKEYEFQNQKKWDSRPNDLKNKELVDVIKIAIKIWKPESFPWRFRQTYLQNTGQL